MSYAEQDGKVVLTLSRDDWMMLLLAMGTATGLALKDGHPSRPWFELVNRVNEGNPNFTPYEVSPSPAEQETDRASKTSGPDGPAARPR
jgi:hypothetical protein